MRLDVNGLVAIYEDGSYVIFGASVGGKELAPEERGQHTIDLAHQFGVDNDTLLISLSNCTLDIEVEGPE